MTKTSLAAIPEHEQAEWFELDKKTRNIQYSMCAWVGGSRSSRSRFFLFTFIPVQVYHGTPPEPEEPEPEEPEPEELGPGRL